MSYDSTSLLRDQDGNFIPQYYDPTAAVFKPIQGGDNAGFELKGSIVDLFNGASVSLATATFVDLITEQTLIDFKEYRIEIRFNQSIPFDLDVRWFSNSGVLIRTDRTTGTSANIELTKLTRSNRVNIRLRSNSESVRSITAGKVLGVR
jgi:hypothetical protein